MKDKEPKKAVTVTQIGNGGVYRVDRVSGFIMNVNQSITKQEVQKMIDEKYFVTIVRNK
jgi:hypothetical protein